MTWTAIVRTDPDKTDVGHATAIWDADGTNEESGFSYSRRVQLTVAGRNAFVAEAQQALTDHQAQLTRNENLKTNLEGALNG